MGCGNSRATTAIVAGGGGHARLASDGDAATAAAAGAAAGAATSPATHPAPLRQSSEVPLMASPDSCGSGRLLTSPITSPPSGGGGSAAAAAEEEEAAMMQRLAGLAGGRRGKAAGGVTRAGLAGGGSGLGTSSSAAAPPSGMLGAANGAPAPATGAPAAAGTTAAAAGRRGLPNHWGMKSIGGEAASRVLFTPSRTALPTTITGSQVNRRLGIVMGSHSHLGDQTEQQDRSVVVASVAGDDSFMFAAVMDGHGGDAVAEYLRGCLVSRVGEALAKERAYVRHAALLPTATAGGRDHKGSTRGGRGGRGGASGGGATLPLLGLELPRAPEPKAHHLATCYAVGEPDFRRLLTYVLQALDAEVMRHTAAVGGTSTGTCVVLAMLYGDALVVGNVGDSEAWLCRSGRPYELSSVHQPANPAESRRIRETGGKIREVGGKARVAGHLAVSRSIGMRDLKLEYLGLVADPFVRVVQLAVPVGTTIPHAPDAPPSASLFEREYARHTAPPATPAGAASSAAAGAAHLPRGSPPLPPHTALAAVPEEPSRASPASVGVSPASAGATPAPPLSLPPSLPPPAHPAAARPEVPPSFGARYAYSSEADFPSVTTREAVALRAAPTAAAAAAATAAATSHPPVFPSPVNGTGLHAAVGVSGRPPLGPAPVAKRSSAGLGMQSDAALLHSPAGGAPARLGGGAPPGSSHPLFASAGTTAAVAPMLMRVPSNMSVVTAADGEDGESYYDLEDRSIAAESAGDTDEEEARDAGTPSAPPSVDGGSPRDSAGGGRLASVGSGMRQSRSSGALDGPLGRTGSDGSSGSGAHGRPPFVSDATAATITGGKGSLHLGPVPGCAEAVVAAPSSGREVAVDEFVILASDGLFDAFPNRQVLVNTVRRYLIETGDADATCERVVREAVCVNGTSGTLRPQQDNTTMVLIVLNQFERKTALAGALGGVAGYARRACARRLHSRATRVTRLAAEDPGPRAGRSQSFTASRSPLGELTVTTIGSSSGGGGAAAGAVTDSIGARSRDVLTGTTTAATGAGSSPRGAVHTPLSSTGGGIARSDSMKARSGSRAWTTDALASVTRTSSLTGFQASATVGSGERHGSGSGTSLAVVAAGWGASASSAAADRPSTAPSRRPTGSTTFLSSPLSAARDAGARGGGDGDDDAEGNELDDINATMTSSRPTSSGATPHVALSCPTPELGRDTSDAGGRSAPCISDGSPLGLPLHADAGFSSVPPLTRPTALA